MEKDLSPALVCVAEKMHNRELPVAGLVCAVDSHYEFAPIINGHGEQFYNVCLSLCLRKADENGLDLILGAEGEELAAFFDGEGRRRRRCRSAQKKLCLREQVDLVKESSCDDD